MSVNLHEHDYTVAKKESYKGLPEGYVAEGIMVDENKNPLIRLAFITHRDVVTEVGYEIAEIIPEDIEGAIDQACRMMHGLPVMHTWIITAEQITKELMKGEEPTQAEIQNGQIAEMMIKEAAKSYSNFYINRKKDWMKEEEGRT